MFPLGLLSNGERGEVVETAAFGNGGGAAAAGPGFGHVHRHGCGGCSGHAHGAGRPRVEDLGIRAGKVVEMLSNEGRGALLVKVDESRIAVGRGVAMKIMVRRTDDESRKP